MLDAGNLIAWPISNPLATSGVGHSLKTLCAAGESIQTLYSFTRFFSLNMPAIIDSSRTF